MNANFMKLKLLAWLPFLQKMKVATPLKKES